MTGVGVHLQASWAEGMVGRRSQEGNELSGQENSQKARQIAIRIKVGER